MDLDHGYTQTTIDGYPCWVNAAGRVWPVIRGGDGPEEPPAPTPAPPATPPAPAAVQFTPEQQAHVDSLLGRTREEGRRVGAQTREQEVADYLAAQAADAQRAEMTEIDRLRAEAAEAVAARTAAEQAAASATARVRATTALTVAGFNPATIEDALTLVGVTPDDDDATVTEKVTALAARLPALLTTTGGPAVTPPPPPVGITPPGPPPTNPSVESDYERGARLAREKYGHLRTA